MAKRKRAKSKYRATKFDTYGGFSKTIYTNDIRTALKHATPSGKHSSGTFSVLNSKTNRFKKRKKFNWVK